MALKRFVLDTALISSKIRMKGGPCPAVYHHRVSSYIILDHRRLGYYWAAVHHHRHHHRMYCNIRTIYPALNRLHHIPQPPYTSTAYDTICAMMVRCMTTTLDDTR